MISVEKVSKRYDNGFEALKHVSFKLESGDMAFLTGHSGAGKSTLLRCLARMEHPTSGRIFFEGQDLARYPRRKIPYLRRKIGFIFQNPKLLYDRSVFANVALPLEILGLTRNECGRKVRAALDMVGLLRKEKCFPDELSCGEQQRLGIARGIVNKPPLLLADEPTGNLDPTLSLEIMRLFEQFNQVGVTVLVATHDLALIAQMSSRLITLKYGQVQA